MSKVKTIDISKIKDQDADGSIDELVNELGDKGFVYIKNHDVSKELIYEFKRFSRRFFELSLESKLEMAPKKYNKNSDKIYRGYCPSSVFGKETFDITDPEYKTGMRSEVLYEENSFSNLISRDDELLISRYYNDLDELGVTLLKLIVRNLGGCEKYIGSGFKRPTTLSTLRLNHYPDQKEVCLPIEISKDDASSLFCETHYDSVFMTLLVGDKSGLQVKDPTSKLWIDVPFLDDCIVLNSGKALEIITDGKIKAVEHRVSWSSKNRISIPFFLEPMFDFDISPKNLFSGKKNLYGRLNYGDYLLESLKKFKEYNRF